MFSQNKIFICKLKSFTLMEKLKFFNFRKYSGTKRVNASGIKYKKVNSPQGIFLRINFDFKEILTSRSHGRGLQETKQRWEVYRLLYCILGIFEPLMILCNLLCSCKQKNKIKRSIFSRPF